MQSRYAVIFLLSFVLSVVYADEHKIIAFYTKNVARASEKDVKLAISQVLQANTMETDLIVNEVFPKNIDDIINGFISKKYAIITINAVDFIANYDRLAPLSSKIWTLSKNQNHKYSTYMIVVRKKADINSFRFKTVAFLRFSKMQEIFFESYLFEKYHHGIDYFFKKKIPFDSSSKMLIKLFFSKIDACVVSKEGWDLSVEMNPQIKEKFKVLKVSKAIFPDIGLTISRKGEKKVSQLYNKMIQKRISIAKVNSILMIYKARAIVEYKEETLKELFALYQKYLKMKKKYEKQ